MTKNRAFTLIELLVVVAIICILAALAVPSYRTVQESGRSAKCASNLRQIGAGMFLFSDDHNNAFPEAGGPVTWGTPMTPAIDPVTNQQAWMCQLGPYVGNPGDPALSPSGSVFTCPSSSLAVAADKYYSYFMSAHAAVVTAGQQVQPKQYGAVKKQLITHPSEQILSGDITDWTNPTGIYGTGAGQTDADKVDYIFEPIDKVSPFQNGEINLLFADGHVEAEKWNNNATPAGYFDQTRMTTHYDGTGPTAGSYYSYLIP